MNKNRNMGRLTVNLGPIFLLLEGFCRAISFCTNQKQIKIKICGGYKVLKIHSSVAKRNSIAITGPNFCNTEINTSMRILLKQVLTQSFS